MNRKKLSIVFFILFILWAAVIFYFSSQPPNISHNQSYMTVRIIRKINDIFDITDSKLYFKMESIIKKIWFLKIDKTPNAVVRKSAHFGIYFILGLISSSFAYSYSKKILIGFLMGFSLPVVIAVLDEFNQAFVGRTSSLNDVIIDGAGAFTGTCLVITVIVVTKSVKTKLWTK